MPRSPHSPVFLWTMVGLTVAAVAGIWVWAVKAQLADIAAERSEEATLVSKAKAQLQEIRATARPLLPVAATTSLKASLKGAIAAQAAERARIEAMKAKLERVE